MLYKVICAIQVDIVLDEYKKNNSSVDKNNDGKIQYVMLEGEPEHQEYKLI